MEEETNSLGRIYFDQSILGGLITLTDAHCRSVPYAGVAVFLHDNFKPTINWGLTPAGLIELIGISIPFIKVDHKSISRAEITWPFELKDRAVLEYSKIITSQYVSRLLKDRLDSCSKAISPGSELGNAMLKPYSEDPSLLTKINGVLGWHYLLQYQIDDIEYDKTLLFIAFESLSQGNAIDFYRLGDRLYWKSLCEKDPSVKRLKKIAKIKDNKDLLDSELLQLAIVGPNEKDSNEHAIIITRDSKFFKKRLLRAFGFFDYLFGVASKSDLAPKIPNIRFGRVITFKDENGILTLEEDYSVKDFLRSATTHFGYEPRYFNLT